MAGPEGKRYHNEKSHGYNFEVPATHKMGLAMPIPLIAMGKFRHEAVAVDAISGAVYQTEDRDDGLIYRFIPNVKGQLAKGGRLEALKVKGKSSLDTRNWESTTMKAGQSVEIEWIPCENVNSDKDDLRYRTFEQGAARFARGEGMWAGNNSIYFAATSGGKANKGQIWRIDPKRNLLTLWVEPNNGHIIENADNLTVAPWGDVVLSEDLATWKTRVDNSNWITGINKRGEVYKIGRNAFNNQELAGVCFSPDGSTLFVNIYHPGMTLAITGPWRG
jgi:secreted PhoX family phosphatase